MRQELAVPLDSKKRQHCLTKMELQGSTSSEGQSMSEKPLGQTKGLLQRCSMEIAWKLRLMMHESTKALRLGQPSSRQAGLSSWLQMQAS